MKRLYFILIFFLLSFCLSNKIYSNSSSEYAVISLKTSVNPVSAEYIVNSIKKANDDGAKLIILTIDTPGGLLTSMKKIIQAIMSSEVPVVTYTYPKGAQATSAGGFIMLAGHINAMSPGCGIGAMRPVSLLPFVKLDENKNPEVKKLFNDIVAYGKSIAQKRNRNEKWVIQAITNAKSSTYLEAKKAGIIDLIANDIPDLLAKINGMDVDINGNKIRINTSNLVKKEYLMSWKENFLDFIADPQVIFLLFIVAVVGIGMEMKNPGIIFPGTLGGISLVFFLMAIRIVPINFFGLILIILGVVLFILEINFTSYGLLTIGGIGSFFFGSMLLFDSPLPGYSIPLSSIIITIIVILLLVFLVVRAIVRVHQTRVTTGQSALIGKIGEALNDFDNNMGKVYIHGEIWNATSGMTIIKGDSVVVKEAHGMNLEVEKK